MAENLGEGKVRIVPDTSGFEQGVTKGVNESMDKAEKSVKSSTKNMNEQIKSVGQTIATAFVTTQVINFAKNTVLAAEEAGKADARIKQIATSMNIFGGNVDAVTQRLVDFASKTQLQVGLDDEIIKTTQAKLLTFKNLAMTADQMGGAFDRATLAAIDMAAAGFGEASNNAVQLGKALQDPIKGITALSRSGITFTAEQKNVIAALVETNQVAAAQDLILQAIEQQVGGTAAATVTASDRMAIAFGELQEQIGAALLPAVQGLSDALVFVSQGIGALPSSVTATVVQMGFMIAATGLLKKNLANLGIQSAALDSSIKGLRFALAGLIIAEGISQLFNEISDASGNLDRKLQALQIAIGGTGSAAQGAQDPVEAFRDLVAAEGKGINLGNLIRDVGKEITIVGGSISRDIEYIDNAFNKLLQSSPKMAQALIDAWTSQNQALDVTSQQYQDNTMLIDRYQERIDLAVGSSNALSASSTDLAGSQTDLGSATALTTEEIEQQEQALRGLVDATMASFSSEIALAQQKRTTGDAIAAFNDLQNQVTTGTYRGSDAMRDMVEASEEVYQSAIRQAESAVRLAQDNAKAAGGQLSAAEAARIQRDELMKVVSTLAPDSPLRRELENYIRRLNAVPTQITSRIDTFYTTYERRVQITSSGMGSGRTMANGGIVTGPTRALIGEAGPEVVIPLTRPQRAMELMQQTGLDRMGAGGYASSRNATVNIENAVFQNGTDADLVAQKVNAAEKARSFST